MSDIDTPQRWECGNCGYAFYDHDGWSQWFCSQCGEEMHTAPPEGYISNEELRTLVKRWRRFSQGHTGPAESNFQQAANELEELITDE